MPEGDIDSVLNAWLVFPLDWQPAYKVLRSKSEAGGLPITRLKTANPTYSGTLTAVFRTEAASNAFMGFFNTQKGGRTSFTWKEPVSETMFTCKFAGDTPGYSKEGPERWVYQFSLIGVET